MKKLKVSLAAMAVILGMGAAFATSTNQTLDKKWGFNRSTGTYEDVTGLNAGTDYDCSGTDAVCTEIYPADVNPNNQENDDHDGIAQPSSMQAGSFLR